MLDIKYKPYCGGEFDLSGRYGMGLSTGELMNFSYKKSDKATTFTLLKEESVVRATLSCLWWAKDKLDELLDNCQTDIEKRIPGTLTFGEWKIDCFLSAGSQTHKSEEGVQYDVQLSSQYANWYKEHINHYLPNLSYSGSGLDFTYDHEYDLGNPLPSKELVVKGKRECPLLIIIYGHCTNPAVTIAGNLYQVNVTVPTGGYLVINTVPSQRGVYLVDALGNRIDCFQNAIRGNGLNSGNYIFQPVKAGRHTVSWNNAFGIDVIVREEKGYLPWQLN